jgi:hypothetical protein
MTGTLKLFVVSLAVLAVAVTAEWMFVPGIMPVGLSDATPPLWSVGLAFLLRAIANVAGVVAIVSGVLGTARCIGRLCGGDARTPRRPDGLTTHGKG